MKAGIKTDAVKFTTKGQVVIPSWLRKEFHIEEGTKCVVQATPDGILLKPMTAALIRRGRGILERPNKTAGADRSAHKRAEIAIEDRHAR